MKKSVPNQYGTGNFNIDPIEKCMQRKMIKIDEKLMG